MDPTRPTPALLAAIGDNAVEAARLLVGGVRSAAPGGQRVALPIGGWVSPSTLHRHVSALVLRLLFMLFAERKGLLRPVLLGDGAGHSPTWDRVVATLCSLCGVSRDEGGVGTPRWGAWLFSRGADEPFLRSKTSPAALVIDDDAIAVTIAQLSTVDGAAVRFEQLGAEQIASVYERLIGFEVVVCSGWSVAMEPDGAVVDVDALLASARCERAAMVERRVGWRPPRTMAQRLEHATTLDGLVEAMAPRLRRGGIERLAPGALTLQPTGARRRLGAHYTPESLARDIVSAALRPWLASSTMTEAALLALRICDPAMGTGIFLVEACRQLADALVKVRHVKGKTDERGGLARARFDVARCCLYGIDLDPLAVDTAGTCLQLFAAGADGALPPLATHLVCGNAVVGLGRWPQGASVPGAFDDPVDAACLAAVPRKAAHTFADAWTASVFEAATHARPGPELERLRVSLGAGREGVIVSLARRLADEHGVRPVHWALRFPEVFGEPGGGFDAMIGNPPWVAYAGRAAQPLDRALFAYFRRASEAFRGYRTLHGLFVHRCASLLREQGRLGLIVPTSLADLQGYGPVRRAHDRLCVVDEELPDFGADAFEDVFQPAMGLLSTRRERGVRSSDALWPLAREDLDPRTRELLERLSLLPSLPGEMFAERGFQSRGEDAASIRDCASAEPPFVVPIREGVDIRPFAALPPRRHLDPSGLGARLRREEAWRAVDVLIRQTARYPIAAPADGIPFRNSILAGFGHETLGAHALLAYLNATPIRWFHYMRHRDARQGMPQVKIAHLRSLPALPPGAGRAVECLNELGDALAVRNDGVRPAEQERLDGVVAEALGISNDELAMMRAWYAGLAPT